MFSMREDDENFEYENRVGKNRVILSPTRQDLDISSDGLLCEVSLSGYEPDEGDYDNPVFKLQDEMIYETDMDSLGMTWSMFY